MSSYISVRPGDLEMQLSYNSGRDILSGATRGGPSVKSPGRAMTVPIKFDEPQFEKKELDALPLIRKFSVPRKVMMRRVERSFEDIEETFRANKISVNITDAFRDFGEEEKWADDLTFSALQHGPKLKQEMPLVADRLTQYMEKALYEMKVPEFKPSSFGRKDEQEYGKFMQKECPGIIKHDRDLLRYFLLTKETEEDLASILVDAVDRISVSDEHNLDLSVFAKKSFFKQLNNKQVSMIKNGLRTYHNRFFPRLSMSPLTLFADKVSDYQKYTCILNLFTQRLVDEKVLAEPALIDFMVIPPGVFTKMHSNFDASRMVEIGDIQQHLDDFNNESYTVLEGKKHGGLSAERDNFDEKEMKRIADRLIKAAKKVIAAANGRQYQRICVVVDRRWRGMDRRHCLYNKIRTVHTLEEYDHETTNKDAFDFDEYAKDQGLSRTTAGDEFADEDDDDDDDEAIYGSKGSQIDFEDEKFARFISRDKTNDSIFVYQPQCDHVRPINEFAKGFCHETLMYLTKNCILPRKVKTLDSFSIGSKKKRRGNRTRKENGDEVEHLNGDSGGGVMFNISVHIYPPFPNNVWYQYRMKWYWFANSASIRLMHTDFTRFWCKYFVDPEKDIDAMNAQQLKKYFKGDLEEIDVQFKRWYHAIRRTMSRN